MGSSMRAPFTKKMSRRPSPSQSNKATPAPMGSTRYFCEVGEASCLNCPPKARVTSTNFTVGAAGFGVAFLRESFFEAGLGTFCPATECEKRIMPARIATAKDARLGGWAKPLKADGCTVKDEASKRALWRRWKQCQG